MKSLFVLCLMLSFVSCSVAPMTSPKSARSLGEKKYELTGGVLPTVATGFSLGATNKLDVGFGYEVQFTSVLSAWTKYSLINNQEGHAFAFYGGVFIASDLTDSKGFFLGPIYSYKYDWFEHYLVTRFNYVHWNSGFIDDGNKDDSWFDSIDWSSGNLSYLQFTYGMNFYTSAKFAINISAQYWYFLGANSGSAQNIIPGLEFIYKF